VISGGGQCSKGDILSASEPVYDNNNGEGWKINCDSSSYNSYGSKNDESKVYAICLWTTYQDDNNDNSYGNGQNNYGGYN